MAQGGGFVTLGDLLKEKAESEQEETILERIKLLAQEHLPEGWAQWEVANLVKEEVFGQDLDSRVLNKLMFALPTVGLALAFNPEADHLSEKGYRDMRRKLLDWAFSRALLLGPPAVANRIRGSAARTELFKQSVEVLRPLLYTRLEADRILAGELPESEGTRRKRRSTSSNGSEHYRNKRPRPDYRYETLEKKMESMFSILMEKIERQSVPETRSEDDESDMSIDSSSWKAPMSPLMDALPSSDVDVLTSDFDFLPQVKEADPLVPEPTAQIKKEGIGCQRLGMDGWNRIRYKEVERLLQASPVFSTLRVNTELNAFVQSSGWLPKLDGVLGTVTHGLLMQRKALSENLKAIAKDFPKAADHIIKILGEDSQFRKLSDNLLQFVCAHRAEVFDCRRKTLNTRNDVLNAALHQIPPSESHIFDEQRFSTFVKENGGVDRIFHGGDRKRQMPRNTFRRPAVPANEFKRGTSFRRQRPSRAQGKNLSNTSNSRPGQIKHTGRQRGQGVGRKSQGYHCLHLQLYRDPKDRFKHGQTKASLSLQQFLGFESGFTLDKESNTLAVVCQDVVVVLAFETRERLISWQVKVGTQLGSSKQFLVLVGGGSKRLAAGPARLHLQGRRFALTSGTPPRLLGLWELQHLRRYGVVEGRFCFEGGSHCGKGEGLHLLITDQAQEITDAFDAAARGDLQRGTRKSTDKGSKSRPSTRLSDFNGADASMPDTASALYEQNFFGEDCGETSPYWPSDERQYEEDYRTSEEVGVKPPWSGADHVTLERCNNCLTKLGVISRTSTVALDPGPQFNPAWTMDPVRETSSDNSSNSTEYLTPRAIKRTLEACQCKEKPPDRPPKPVHLDQRKPPAPLPAQACMCGNDNYPINNPKVGPYENYDVPKTTHTEVENEYYDTPKRLKQALADDLFQVTKPTAPGSLVLKKNCGCILKFASRKKPVIVECEETIQPVECPCQKVTNWANNLISLPYCKRNENINTEIFIGPKPEDMAIYATVDVSRKTNRQSAATDKDNTPEHETQFMNYQNIEPKDSDFEGPYANYENLEFALSLEYYENAKDLLKKAGVTQTELDALSANVEFAATTLPKKTKTCSKCIQPQAQDCRKTKQDEYLLMEPAKQANQDTGQRLGTTTGYTPMSPNPNWSQSLRHPINKVHRADIEKSLSIPTLIGANIPSYMAGNNNKELIQKRSSSVDSARLLEDLKEFDSSIGSHATSSSLETLRNLALENRRSSSPCDNDRECEDCCKSSGSENKTSESSSKDAPPLRNKHMDNAQIKRSSSVPCKSGGNRDSSSSNDSGVSSCSLKHGGGEFNEFEMPLTSGQSKYHYMMHKKMRGSLSGCVHSALPRKSKSSDPLRDMSMQIHKAHVHAKSSSAEAEVPVLPPKPFKGVMDTHSTSSGTSDMSDYIETLSLTSSHSSSDTACGMRLSRQPTSTLRPRSGKEYHNIDPIITSMYKNGKDLSNYTNLP